MPGLTDIAKAAHISPTAVSAVLHGGATSIRVSQERQQRIVSAAKALAYRPNADLALVVRGDLQLESEGALLFAHALQIQAPGRIQVVVAGATEVPEVVQRWKVSGVICFDHEHPLLSEHCHARGIPCLYANPSRSETAPAVHIADECGVAEAASALLAGDCTHLALCAPAIHHQAHARRITSLKNVAEAAGVPCHIADAREFAQAVKSLELKQPGCGILVLADWYLALETHLASQGGNHQLVSIKRPRSPWIQAPRFIDIPWSAVAKTCLDAIASAWAGTPLPPSATVASSFHQGPLCVSPSLSS